MHVECHAPSSTGFGGLVAEPANFAVVQVPASRWLDGRRWTLSCRAPFLTLTASRGRSVIACESGAFVHRGEPLRLVDLLLERLRPRRSSGLPFEGGLVGFLGYELLDGSEVPRGTRCDAWLAFPRQARITPDAGDELEIRLDDLPEAATLLRELGCEPLAEQRQESAGHGAGQTGDPPSKPPGRLLASRDGRRRFVSAVEQCQRLIAAGDLYQANLSHQLEISMPSDARALAAASWRRDPAPHQTFVDCGEFQVVGASPELFLRRRGHRIAVRPIKGTRRRGPTTIEDSRLRRDLAEDPKEAAEHVMIVDLERNDLGRIARTGSVAVPELMAVETFGTVHHLVSTVMAECRPETSVSDILRATFPCGSVTGAPKIRARQVIRELERGPRGVYTGATGFIDCRGDLELAVAIRTALVEPNLVRYGVGAGIVTDSLAAGEWDETLLKSTALQAALDEVVSAAHSRPPPASQEHEEDRR